ncbi:MAG: 50S ribosomal protein L27 [Deltaproteobacteria bacterium]|nr:50S ribosomal protein L27 [Deltaproteobacteria bacterium]
MGKSRSGVNGRNSSGQRRGVKVHAGQPIRAGGIIVRQVGSHFHAGENVGTGKDYTLFALQDGTVQFSIAGARRVVSVKPAG